MLISFSKKKCSAVCSEWLIHHNAMKTDELFDLLKQLGVTGRSVGGAPGCDTTWALWVE